MSHHRSINSALNLANQQTYIPAFNKANYPTFLCTIIATIYFTNLSAVLLPFKSTVFTALQSILNANAATFCTTFYKTFSATIDEADISAIFSTFTSSINSTK